MENLANQDIDFNIIKLGGFCEDELKMLSDEDLRTVQCSVLEGIKVNKTFKRSNKYPLPRDLSFSGEKSLFSKWAKGKKSLVEIGVFEGSSAIVFRKSMDSTATLHLIDPYVVVPDSGLVARPWMAKINLMRSLNGNVRWYQEYSHKVAALWSHPIDFLFIDGDHSYGGTMLDWESWNCHVVEGGIVMFHDARMGKDNTGEWGGWPGPTKVVDELFYSVNALSDWEVVDELGSLVVVRKR